MKKVALVLLFVCMSFIISCNGHGSKQSISPDEWMKELKNYTAEAEITFTLNQKTSTMKVKQDYDMAGHYALTVLEPTNLKGYVTTWDGDKIEEYNPITDKKVQAKPSQVKNQVLFGAFVHNYLHVKNDERKLEEENGTLVIEIPIPGHYKYMATEKVWFNSTTKTPTQMVIYDKEGKDTIKIVFTDFQYNQR